MENIDKSQQELNTILMLVVEKLKFEGTTAALSYLDTFNLSEKDLEYVLEEWHKITEECKELTIEQDVELKKDYDDFCENNPEIELYTTAEMEFDRLEKLGLYKE